MCKYPNNVPRLMYIYDQRYEYWSIIITFSLETQNGIEIEQVGKLKDDKKTLVVMGSYAYTGADGRRYRVR